MNSTPTGSMTPTIEQLYERTPMPDNVSPEIAVIATNSPDIVSEAANRTILTTREHTLRAATCAYGADIMQQGHIATLQPVADGENARRALAEASAAAAQGNMAAEYYRDEEFIPGVDQLEAAFRGPSTTASPEEHWAVSDLTEAYARQDEKRREAARHNDAVQAAAESTDRAHAVIAEQERLARPIRRLGTLACASATGIIGGGLMEIVRQVSESSHSGDTIATLTTAGAASFLGATFGYLGLSGERVKASIAHRMAKRRLRV